ncbi:unnamed protein product [Blepharisma stoltei]|uniref:SET domain-containing protein n=1 Tax=Blepharisma stoltei TaxID=1481888 RepID=A0AAU9JMC2_9CILI|nr:unnamed protein product [Blepharisma stoltei]
MAVNSFSAQLGDLLFSVAKRPGIHLMAFIQKSIENEYKRIYYEQMIYQAAFLAKVRRQHLAGAVNFDTAYEEANEMSIEEHKIYAKGEYLEQIYNILGTLHNIARNIEVVYDKKQYENSGKTSLLDPNSFPIADLSNKHLIKDMTSIWTEFPNDVNPKLIDGVGFRTYTYKSTINHPEAGLGVFTESEKPIPPGTLLGFFPGIVYPSSTMEVKISRSKILKAEFPFIQRYNGTGIFHDDPLLYPAYYLGYTVEEYLHSRARLKNFPQIEIRPDMLNPYALGHMINHPPPNTSPNVGFIDLEVPYAFFPSFLMRYFPYMIYSEISKSRAWTNRNYHVVGVVSLKELHNEELFVNYGGERFPQDFAPEWMHVPPECKPIAPYLCKEEALYEFSRLNKMLIKWDEITASAIESVEMEREKQKQQRIKESLEDPKIFEKYYNKPK